MTTIEWTTYDRRPPGKDRQRTTPTRSDSYWEAERRRYGLDPHPARPDYGCYGTVAPFNVPLDDGRGNHLRFSPDTGWLDRDGHPLGDRTVPLQLEHDSRLIGYATVNREPNALVADATIYAPFRKAVGDRHHLSIGLGPYDTRQRDGILHVTLAVLREISLVHTPRWGEHCAAAIWQRAGVAAG